MIIETKFGKVEGIRERDCIVFRGIPYAAPPVGELRFAKPKECEPWQGVLKADRFGARSMQGPHRGGFYLKEFYSNPDFQIPESEDCLYLNIWMPSGTDTLNDRLPVAVYVHGGAFLSGAGSNLPFVCDKLVSRGVIVVTINYRLGALGFLCHPYLGVEGENKAGGNYGLWDQVAALKWVKENIEAFGGDKDNITAFGQSAGAMSLQALALSDELVGVVKDMILQSGGGYKNPLGEFRTVEKASEISEMLFEEIGADVSDRSDVIEKLRALSSDELFEKSRSVIGRCFAEQKGMPFVPVADGELLVDDGAVLIDRGHYLHVPYILGCNGDDITTEGNEVKMPENNPMHVADISFARKVCDAGQKAFVYYFDRKMPGDDAGAFHSAELWYVFGSLEYCWRPLEKRDYELSEEMITYWTNFMKSGNPNGPEEVPAEWKCCGDEAEFMELK